MVILQFLCVLLNTGSILLNFDVEAFTQSIFMLVHANNVFECVFILITMSRVMGKPTFCICENKDPDQLRGNREADQCLCFRYIGSTIPLLSKSEISSRLL